MDVAGMAILRSEKYYGLESCFDSNSFPSSDFWVNQCDKKKIKLSSTTFGVLTIVLHGAYACVFLLENGTIIVF